jgi:hypothetical protein
MPASSDMGDVSENSFSSRFEFGIGGLECELDATEGVIG